jgi:hypothetical protein
MRIRSLEALKILVGFMGYREDYSKTVFIEA